MKHLKFISLAVFASLFMCFALVGCGGTGPIAKLVATVQLVDKECPMDVGAYMQMTGVTFDEESKTVIQVMQFTKAADDFDFSEVKANKENLKKSASLMLSKNDDTEANAMFDLMVKAETGWTIKYVSSDGNDEIALSFTNDELKKIRNNPLSEEQKNKLILSNNLLMSNLQCPSVVGDGITMKKVYDAVDCVTYEYEVDENVLDLRAANANLEVVVESMKQGVYEMLADPMFAGEIKVITDLGKGMKYHYVGDQSGVTLDVDFTVEELQGCLAK